MNAITSELLLGHTGWLRTPAIEVLGDPESAIMGLSRWIP